MMASSSSSLDTQKHKVDSGSAKDGYFRSRQKVKVDILKTYVGGWVPILNKSAAQILVVIDGFAGSGEYKTNDNECIPVGSAPVMLEGQEHRIGALCDFVIKNTPFVLGKTLLKDMAEAGYIGAVPDVSADDMLTSPKTVRFYDEQKDMVQELIRFVKENFGNTSFSAGGIIEKFDKLYPEHVLCALSSNASAVIRLLDRNVGAITRVGKAKKTSKFTKFNLVRE